MATHAQQTQTATLRIRTTILPDTLRGKARLATQVSMVGTVSTIRLSRRQLAAQASVSSCVRPAKVAMPTNRTHSIWRLQLKMRFVHPEHVCALAVPVLMANCPTRVDARRIKIATATGVKEAVWGATEYANRRGLARHVTTVMEIRAQTDNVLAASAEASSNRMGNAPQKTIVPPTIAKKIGGISLVVRADVLNIR